NRRDVDDATVTPAHHPARGRTAEPERPVRVDREDTLPLVVRDVEGLRGPAGDARAVHEHVEPPELALDAFDRRVRIGGAGDVTLQRQDVAGAGGEIEDGHPRAVRAEPLDGRRADAARTAGDERDAAREVVGIHRRVSYHAWSGASGGDRRTVLSSRGARPGSRLPARCTPP